MTPMPARLGLAVVAGVLTALAFEPFAWAALLPIGVAGVTLAVAGTSGPRGMLVGSTYGVAFMLVLLPWLQVIGVGAWIGLSVVQGLYYGGFGAAAAVVARLRFWPVWVAASWVGFESLRGAVPFGGFPWGRLAFGTIDTPVAPAVAYVGSAGTSFLVALVGTTLAWAVARPAPEVTAVTGSSDAAAATAATAAGASSPLRAGAVLASLALAGCAAVVPFTATDETDETDETGAPSGDVRVAAVQGDVPGTGLAAMAERRVVLENHVSATRGLAERVERGSVTRPDLVVWPENSSDIDPYADPTAGAAIAGAARAVGVPLLMGAVVGDRTEDGWFNRAIVWSAEGEPGATYDKTHPVPFGEYIPLRDLLAPRVPALQQIPRDMIPGDRPGVLEVGPVTAGVLMCFEVAYDGLLRDLVDGGANLVVVPTNNATYTGTGQVAQQFAMSRLRAIETHRPVVVASTNGISGMVSADGEVVARAPEQQQAVLAADLTPSTVTTPAVRWGAAIELALGVTAAVAVLTGLALGYRRRSTVAPRTTELTGRTGSVR